MPIILKRGLQLSAFLYLAACGLLYFYQANLVFNFAPVSADHTYKYQAPHEFITLKPEGEDEGAASVHGVRFFARNKVTPADQVIVYFKGNAGNISHSDRMAQPYLAMGYDVISMDYRGFGKSTGDFSESALLADALGWIDYAASLYGQNNIKVVAWSMGGAFAAHVAAETPIKEFAVFAPFKSVIDMGYRRYPYFVHEWFSRFPLRSDLRLARVESKNYVVYHGTADRIVPYESGQALVEAASKPSVSLVTVEGANHFTIPWDDKVLSHIKKRWQLHE